MVKRASNKLRIERSMYVDIKSTNYCCENTGTDRTNEGTNFWCRPETHILLRSVCREIATCKNVEFLANAETKIPITVHYNSRHEGKGWINT